MPEPILLGDTGARIVDIQREFDPATGFKTTIIWEGSEDAMNTMLPSMGGQARTYQFNGPVWRLAARYGDAQDGSNEIPFDKWHIDTEMAEISIWESAYLAELVGGEDSLADLKFLVLYFADQKKTPLETGFVGTDYEVYVEYYVRGVKAFQVKRPTLRRVRTISLSYASPIEIAYPEPVYTTAKLISTFGVPAAIAAQLPDNPTFVPSGRAWAWKQQKETSENIVALNKKEEQTDWVFAPWSLVNNRLIS